MKKARLICTLAMDDFARAIDKEVPVRVSVIAAGRDHMVEDLSDLELPARIFDANEEIDARVWVELAKIDGEKVKVRLLLDDGDFKLVEIPESAITGEISG